MARGKIEVGVNVSGTEKIQRVTKDLDKVGKEMNKVGSALGAAGLGKFGDIFGAIGAGPVGMIALAAASIGAFAKYLVDANVESKKQVEANKQLAYTYKMTAFEVQFLNSSLEKSGIKKADKEGIAKILSSTTEKLSSVARGIETDSASKQILDKLGLSEQDFSNGKSGMVSILEAIQKISNEAERANIFDKLYGGDAAKMKDYFDKNEKDIVQLVATFQKAFQKLADQEYVKLYAEEMKKGLPKENAELAQVIVRLQKQALENVIARQAKEKEIIEGRYDLIKAEKDKKEFDDAWDQLFEDEAKLRTESAQRQLDYENDFVDLLDKEAEKKQKIREAETNSFKQFQDTQAKRLSLSQQIKREEEIIANLSKQEWLLDNDPAKKQEIYAERLQREETLAALIAQQKKLEQSAMKEGFNSIVNSNKESALQGAAGVGIGVGLRNITTVQDTNKILRNIEKNTRDAIE